MSFDTTMKHKGFVAQIMEAERLRGNYTHELPPGSPLNVYPSQAFIEWPESWLKGPEVFLVPVRPEKGSNC